MQERLALGTWNALFDAAAPHMRFLTLPRRNGRSPLDPPRPCADVRVKQCFRPYAPKIAYVVTG